MGVVSDWLYKGADAGTKAATQNQVKNLGWGQIAKNVWNDKAGFDKNYKGAGATNRANYTWQGLKSLFGGKTAGNIAGGTPASRQLFEKVLQSPVGRYLPAAGGIMRTALSGSMTAGPTGAYAMYQMNKPSTPAGFNYAQNLDRNSISSIADETAGLDYQQDYMQGVMDADKNYLGAEQTKSPIAENDLMNYNEHYNMMPEEEKEGFLSFLQNAGVNTRDFVMDNAARYGGAMGGAKLGSMFGPIGALAGMIGGGIFGNKFTNQPYLPASQGAYGYSADQLNKMNALGGYYSEPARAQRQLDGRFSNLMDRAQSGKTFSTRNLLGISKALGMGVNRDDINKITSGAYNLNTGDGPSGAGTFTKESIDQSFSGEEGPTGGTSSGSRNETGFGSSGMGRDPNDRMATGGIVGLYR
jgi:hypothetical protein